MNTLNRIVIVALLLVMMVLMTAIFVLPHVILLNVGQWLVQWGNYFWGVQALPRLGIGIVLAILVDAIGLLLIFLEVRPKRKHFIRVQQVTGGTATLSRESIIQQLQYKLDPLPGVIQVKPNVNAKGDKVQAVVDVEVAAGSNVPSMAAQLMEMVQTILTGDLGLQVYGQPEVRIKVAPGPASPAPKPVPQPRPVKSTPAPPPIPLEEPKDWAGSTPEDREKPLT